MTWLYEQQTVNELPDDCVGFVYLITNTVSGRKYIGKKLAKFRRTTYRVHKLKNGTKKKKKIRSKVDSDWQTYFGSSPELSRDVEQLGPEKFTREILYYCKSKAECSYIEAREQFSRRVLESTDYYNGHIQVRVHGSHIINKLTESSINSNKD
jgi:Putative endonuclease segE, GIY-YIG domain